MRKYDSVIGADSYVAWYVNYMHSACSLLYHVFLLVWVTGYSCLLQAVPNHGGA